MKYSIVPEIINNQGIQLLNESDIEIFLSEKVLGRYASPFTIPYLVIDTFAKKTSNPEEIVRIEIPELKKLGYALAVIQAKRKWFKGQRVIYMLERITNPSPGARRINHIPSSHRIDKDVANQKVRIVGINSGYPHYPGQKGGHGPWCDIK